MKKDKNAPNCSSLSCFVFPVVALGVLSFFVLKEYWTFAERSAMQRKMLPIEVRAMYEFASKGQYDAIVRTGLGSEDMVDCLKAYDAKAGRVIAYSVTEVVATGAKSEIDLEVTRTSGKYKERVIAMGTYFDWSLDEEPVPIP